MPSEFAHPAWPHLAHLDWPHLMLIFCLRVALKSSNFLQLRLTDNEPRFEDGKRSVKRRLALQECNLPRNNRSQTHQDDETRGAAVTCFVPVLKNNIGLIDLPMPQKTQTRSLGTTHAGRSRQVTIFSSSFPSSGGSGTIRFLSRRYEPGRSLGPAAPCTSADSETPWSIPRRANSWSQ